MTKRQPEVIEIDKYVPNWSRRCVACDRRPVVEGAKDRKIIRLAQLCGPCTFGTAAALDPAGWNSLDD